MKASFLWAACNHDDFGGHAKRNEFRFHGRTFIGYGGTMGIATPFPYSYTAKRLVEELGIQVERNSKFQTREAFQAHHSVNNLLPNTGKQQVVGPLKVKSVRLSRGCADTGAATRQTNTVTAPSQAENACAQRDWSSLSV